MRQLPRTYYDITRSRRPEMMAEIEQQVAELRAVEWPFRLSDLDDLFLPVAEAELARIFGAAWSQSPDVFRRAGVFTKEQMIEQVPGSSELARLKQQIGFDYQTGVNFRLFGSKVFYFSENIVQRLAETELNVISEAVVPPFRSCAFVYDDPVALEAFYAIQGHPVQPVKAPITVFASLLEEPDGAQLLLHCIHANDQKTFMGVVRGLLLKNGRRVEDALRTDWVAEGRASEIRLTGTEDDDSRFYGLGLRFFRIVINSVLYLGSSAPDISGELRASDRIPQPRMGMSAKEKRHLAHKTANASQLSYVEVGPSVPPLSANNNKDQGKQLTQRFLVRGHWRNQPHGPGGSKRKLIFIEPHWKGPDMAEAVNKPYVVK